MQVIHQDRTHILTERRKLQMEVENKKRQLEDDRRALQHLKSKSLRERWLLDSESSGLDQDQDQSRTQILEDTIHRLEQELLGLEAESSCEAVTHSSVTSGPVPDYREVTEVKVQKTRVDEATRALAEVKGHKSPQMNEEMKRAMYSVQITVERDNLTGETRVLSSSTTPPVLTDTGVKVYEDTHRVVHEVDGERSDDCIHLLSSSEVDELLLQADRAAMMPPAIATATSGSGERSDDCVHLPSSSEVDELLLQADRAAMMPPAIATATSGSGEPDLGTASEEHPVTMVFMGYQDVEDEDQTKRVLGLQGAVRAELVLLREDTPTSAAVTPAATPIAATPTAEVSTEHCFPPTAAVTTPTTAMVTPTSALATPTDAPAMPAKAPPVTKEKKPPCRCCSIM